MSISFHDFHAIFSMWCSSSSSWGTMETGETQAPSPCECLDRANPRYGTAWGPRSSMEFPQHRKQRTPTDYSLVMTHSLWHWKCENGHRNHDFSYFPIEHGGSFQFAMSVITRGYGFFLSSLDCPRTFFGAGGTRHHKHTHRHSLSRRMIMMISQGHDQLDPTGNILSFSSLNHVKYPHKSTDFIANNIQKIYTADYLSDLFPTTHPVSIYPLVNCPITMDKCTMFNG